MLFPLGPACGEQAQGFSVPGSHSDPGDKQIEINYLNCGKITSLGIFNVRFDYISCKNQQSTGIHVLKQGEYEHFDSRVNFQVFKSKKKY